MSTRFPQLLRPLQIDTDTAVFVIHTEARGVRLEVTVFFDWLNTDGKWLTVNLSSRAQNLGCLKGLTTDAVFPLYPITLQTISFVLLLGKNKYTNKSFFSLTSYTIKLICKESN